MKAKLVVTLVKMTKERTYIKVEEGKGSHRRVQALTLQGEDETERMMIMLRFLDPNADVLVFP